MGHMERKIGEYAIILNAKGEFLMLRFPPPNNTWHFPGGRLDEGEESLDGLRREVKEETNLDIIDPRPVHTTIFTREKKYGVFFLARAQEPYEVRISSEHQEYRWFTKAELDSIRFWQPFYKEMLEKNL